MNTTNHSLLIKAAKGVIAKLQGKEKFTIAESLAMWNIYVKQASKDCSALFTYDFPTTGYTRKAHVVEDLQRCIEQLEDTIAREADVATLATVEEVVMKNTPVAAVVVAIIHTASIHESKSGFSVHVSMSKIGVTEGEVEACSFLVGTFFKESSADEACVLALSILNNICPIQTKESTMNNENVAFGNLAIGDVFEFNGVAYEKIAPVSAGVIGSPDAVCNVQALVDVITPDLENYFEDVQMVEVNDVQRSIPALSDVQIEAALDAIDDAEALSPNEMANVTGL